LQRIVGVPQDGKIGPVTLKAVRARKPENVASQLCDVRLAFVKGLNTWLVFGKGWGRRIAEVRSISSQWASRRVAA
jgi:lysozyme family protein